MKSRSIRAIRPCSSIMPKSITKSEGTQENNDMWLHLRLIESYISSVRFHKIVHLCWMLTRFNQPSLAKQKSFDYLPQNSHLIGVLPRAVGTWVWRSSASNRKCKTLEACAAHRCTRLESHDYPPELATSFAVNGKTRRHVHALRSTPCLNSAVQSSNLNPNWVPETPTASSKTTCQRTISQTAGDTKENSVSI